MDLSNLNPAAGSTKKKKRVGRGEGSGSAGTAGKGHKGQKARSGGGVPTWFEGGQMPLQRRVPKYGFKNRDRVAYDPINLGRLSQLVERHARRRDHARRRSARTASAARTAASRSSATALISSALTVHAHAFRRRRRRRSRPPGGTATVVA